MIRTRHRRTQQGSALLVVLVFAAIIAIMLYREMPVVTFEAKRHKEELLMDRGNEYERAIKLYVRKFQIFPPSIEALENTNRMRFLRSRYVDPFTGKDDWRLLHAGPGGIITDSKLKQNPLLTNPAGQPGGSTLLGAPAAAVNPFANSFNGANPAPAGPGPPGAGAAQNFPQRPPAIATSPTADAANSDGEDSVPGASQEGQQQVDPQAIIAALQQQRHGDQPQPAQSQVVPYPGYPGPPSGPLYGQAGQTDSSQAAQGNPMTGSSGGLTALPARFRGSPTGESYAPGGPAGSAGSPGQNDPQATMQSLLNAQNPQPSVQRSGATGATGTTGTSQMGSMGATAGGGIAGVASKSAGTTIKVFNDQSDRSLWEFVYDMRKEALANAPGQGNVTPQNNPSSPTSGQTSSFGSSNNSSVFNNPASTNQPSQSPN